MFDGSFYKRKKVFVTGHTGFKGSWITTVLINAGAEVTGFSSCREGRIRLFDLCGIEKDIEHIKGDIRDREAVENALKKASPEIVIHMAAQPIVREGYKDPAVTYDTNVMGTVNILEAVRKTDSVRSFLNVTTDKVYRNMEWEYGYRETDALGGFDPYSCSKSCSELITDTYRDCFLKERGMAVSSARAGNVIGGGDFAPDRIIPDCIRAALKGKVIDIRNPFSVRPYQHVLDPVCAYLLIAAMQYKDIRYASSYNIGPDEGGCISTGQLADLFVSEWGDNVSWRAGIKDGPHESCLLRLDCSRMKAVFGWKPVWTAEEAVRKTVEMTRCIRDHGDVRSCMEKQIQEFFLCQIM